MSITPLSPFTTLPSDAEGPIETGSCAVDPVPSRIGFVAPLLMAIAVVVLSGCGSDDQSLANRQQAVAEAGADVMPFTLDATNHVFVDTSTGGIQDVAADDPSDTTNIGLIRLHLEDEATKFRAGDFSDPEAVHGPGMPGLATLKERYAEISVELVDTEVGATITYSSDDADVVDAIHDWFAAQSTDHGDHETT